MKINSNRASYGQDGRETEDDKEIEIFNSPYGEKIGEFNDYLSYFSEYQYDYEEYGGAPLLGVNGVLIVSHGTSSPKAVKNSLIAAQKCISENLLGDIQHGIQEHMGGLN